MLFFFCFVFSVRFSSIMQFSLDTFFSHLFLIELTLTRADLSKDIKKQKNNSILLHKQQWQRHMEIIQYSTPKHDSKLKCTLSFVLRTNFSFDCTWSFSSDVQIPNIFFHLIAKGCQRWKTALLRPGKKTVRCKLSWWTRTKYSRKTIIMNKVDVRSQSTFPFSTNKQKDKV